MNCEALEIERRRYVIVVVARAIGTDSPTLNSRTGVKVNKNPGTGIARRSVIRGAATVAVSLAIGELGLMTSPGAWAAEPNSPARRLATTNPVSVDEYVHTMPPSGDATGTTTLLAGVHDEYRKAVAIFPLPLPTGYTFPVESSTSEPDGEAGTRFSVGTGAAEAYFFWQNATATAAYSAYLRGDHGAARSLLDAAVAGYATSVRKMVVQDPTGVFVTDSIKPARSGDFAALRAQGVDHFISNPSTRAIAARAGDTF